jgi:D-beta-D-heptose 7-phosphate kinase/D-beta-D-heptose 1-phosphate adenosyltransferase
MADSLSAPRMGTVLTIDELIVQLGSRKRNGQKVVFTNGCFDLLHPGHIRSLESARALGDLLVVGVNSDASVRSNKTAGRPIIPAEERAELLAALQCVDYVVVFDEPTPRELIARVLPDVLVKGGDWGASEIVGREEVEAAGGRVVSAEIVPRYSTTGLIEKIRSAAAHNAPLTNSPSVRKS